MQFIVFGVGSSAGRFIKILQTKGHRVSVYKHKPTLEVPEDCEVCTSLQDLSTFDGGIISSPTATHLEYVQALIDQQIPTLVEKPFSDSLTGVREVVTQAAQQKTFLMTALNLRFLPINQKIKEYIDGGRLGQIFHADLYVGQYLPTWRPWLDYRTNYSSSYARGGGVALDLIHEIDLAMHFFEASEIALEPVVSEKLSDLEIDTEDFVQLRTATQPFVQVTLDYLHFSKTRQYRIVGSDGSINCDIINQRFEYRSRSGDEEILTDADLFNVGQTFTTEIEAFISGIKAKKQPALTDRSLGIDALQVAVQARKHVPR